MSAKPHRPPPRKPRHPSPRPHELTDQDRADLAESVRRRSEPVVPLELARRQAGR